MPDKMVKIRLLADSFRLYKYDEDGQVIKKRGYKLYGKNDVFEAPDWVADALCKQSVTSPSGYSRPMAVKEGEDAPNEVQTELNPGVTPFPEGDFGSTRVDGSLISDPNNELQDQRVSARNNELTPTKKAATATKRANDNPQGEGVERPADNK